MSERERQLRFDPANTSNAHAGSPLAWVAVVEVDAARRQHLLESLESLPSTTRPFASAEQFLASPDRHQFGCVVANFDLQSISGLELQQRMLHAERYIPFVFIAATPDTPSTVSAIRHGAVDVLHPPWDPAQLLSSVHEALERWSVTSSILAKRREIRNRIDTLTPNEKKIMDMILAGELNKTMANRLSVSIRTIENWRRRLFQKMESPSVPHLVRQVLEARCEDLPAAAGVVPLVRQMIALGPHRETSAPDVPISSAGTSATTHTHLKTPGI